MTLRIYIEGGAKGQDSKEMKIRCREGFRRLVEKCGFGGRMPKLIACGGRDATFDDFKTAHQNNPGNAYLALLVDSEEPVRDIEKTWNHLKARDNWNKPNGADDEQVLLMTTCMETWIASDRPTLQKHYGVNLKEVDLPALVDVEKRHRHDVQDALAKATSSCKNSYEKGKRSFEILAELSPKELRKFLPSFERFERVLNARL